MTSAIVRPEDLVRRWGGVHVAAIAEPVTRGRSRSIKTRGDGGGAASLCGVLYHGHRSGSRVPTVWRAAGRLSPQPTPSAPCASWSSPALVAGLPTRAAAGGAAPRRRRPRGAAHAEQRGGHGSL